MHYSEEAIFLSASVPDFGRESRFSATADSVAITSAIAALVHVTLGRRRLIWGGHPAITPIIYATAEEMDIPYSPWVTIYQSKHFKDRYPADNEKFGNVIYTDEVKGNEDDNLAHMRDVMIRRNRFSAGIFIGGMDGVLKEFRAYCDSHAHNSAIVLGSTGGAALEILLEKELEMEDLDYVSIFHERLGISPRETRYQSPEQQPVDVDARLRDIPDLRPRHRF